MKSTKIKGYMKKIIIFSFLLSFLLLSLVSFMFFSREVTDPGDGIPHEPFIWVVLWRYLCEVPLSGPVVSAGLELDPRWRPQTCGETQQPSRLQETAMSQAPSSSSFATHRWKQQLPAQQLPGSKHWDTTGLQGSFGRITHICSQLHMGLLECISGQIWIESH